MLRAVGDLQPRAGVHYPRSTGEFQSWFATDADCLDYLDWLRWPGGFVCPKCGHGGGWAVADGRYKCAACGKRTSVTAGTLFDRRRTPLTVWFEACWLFDLAPKEVEVVVHPQSSVHAMVEFTDGSVVAQVSATDMRMPIQYALTDRKSVV